MFDSSKLRTTCCKKDAHRYLFESKKPRVETFRETTNLFQKNYNSVIWRKQTKNHLSGLQDECLVKNDAGFGARLAVVFERIFTKSRQVLETYQGHSHKIESLCNAIVGHQWAKESLSRSKTAGLSYQQLYVELEIAAQLKRKTNAAEA